MSARRHCDVLGNLVTDHKWYPAMIREHACAEDENLCSLSQKIQDLVLLLGPDLGYSNFDEFYKAAGNSLYGRVFQSQPVGIVWCG